MVTLLWWWLWSSLKLRRGWIFITPPCFKFSSLGSYLANVTIVFPDPSLYSWFLVSFLCNQAHYNFITIFTIVSHVLLIVFLKLTAAAVTWHEPWTCMYTCPTQPLRHSLNTHRNTTIGCATCCTNEGFKTTRPGNFACGNCWPGHRYPMPTGSPNRGPKGPSFLLFGLQGPLCPDLLDSLWRNQNLHTSNNAPFPLAGCDAKDPRSFHYRLEFPHACNDIPDKKVLPGNQYYGLGKWIPFHRQWPQFLWTLGCSPRSSTWYFQSRIINFHQWRTATLVETSSTIH